jgi:D-erythrulose 1-phosphate 3-epimerase
VKLTLAINNCFAVKRWPRADEWAEIIRGELGLSVVQHSLDLSDLDDDPEAAADAIAGACQRRGLVIDSVFTGLVAYSANAMLAPQAEERERADADWARLIRFAARLGARSAGGHVGSLSRVDADNRGRRALLWSELGGRLAELSRLARRSGLDALLVENMACDREPCRMSEVAELLSPGDSERASIALCLDVGHQCAPGVTGPDADPYAWLREMGPRAPIVHLQQSDAAGDHHWPFTPEYNDRGRIHGREVLDALGSSDADEVTLVLEIIPPFEADDARVLGELRESVMYWQEVLADHE